MKIPHRQQGSVLNIVLLLLIVALGAYIGWQYSQKEAAPVVHEDSSKQVVVETADTTPIKKETVPPAPPLNTPPITPSTELDSTSTKQADAEATSSSSEPTKKQVVTEAITDIIETTTSEVIPAPTTANTHNKIEEIEKTKSESEPNELATAAASNNTTELNETTDTPKEVEQAVETTTTSPVIIDQKPVATLPIQLRYKDHFQPNRIIVLTVEIENNTTEALEAVAGDVVLSLESKEIARLSLAEHDILAEKNKARRYQLSTQQSKTWGVEIAETRLPTLYETLSVTPVEQFQVQFIQAEK